MKSRKIAMAAMASMLLGACGGVPDSYIQPDVMSELLADLHIGDAVVDLNRREYDDSARQALKQAIFEAHGVDAELFDSSLVWYAHHPKIYLEIYENTVHLLEDRMHNNDAQIAQSMVSATGDSVDLWAGSRYLAVNSLSADNVVVFNIDADDNSDAGDRYKWRAKFINNIPHVRWGIAANYTDGTTESLDAEAADEGWNEIEFVSDSSLTIDKVYGYIRFEPRERHTIWVDSIQLIRNRRSPNTYHRRYRLKKYRHAKAVESDAKADGSDVKAESSAKVSES